MRKIDSIYYRLLKFKSQNIKHSHDVHLLLKETMQDDLSLKQTIEYFSILLEYLDYYVVDFEFAELLLAFKFTKGHEFGKALVIYFRCLLKVDLMLSVFFSDSAVVQKCLCRLGGFIHASRNGENFWYTGFDNSVRNNSNETINFASLETNSPVNNDDNAIKSTHSTEFRNNTNDYAYLQSKKLTDTSDISKAFVKNWKDIIYSKLYISLDNLIVQSSQLQEIYSIFAKFLKRNTDYIHHFIKERHFSKFPYLNNFVHDFYNDFTVEECLFLHEHCQEIDFEFLFSSKKFDCYFNSLKKYRLNVDEEIRVIKHIYEHQKSNDCDFSINDPRKMKKDKELLINHFENVDINDVFKTEFGDFTIDSLKQEKSGQAIAKNVNNRYSNNKNAESIHIQRLTDMNDNQTQNKCSFLRKFDVLSTQISQNKLNYDDFISLGHTLYFLFYFYDNNILFENMGEKIVLNNINDFVSLLYGSIKYFSSEKSAEISDFHDFLNDLSNQENLTKNQQHASEINNFVDEIDINLLNNNEDKITSDVEFNRKHQSKLDRKSINIKCKTCEIRKHTKVIKSFKDKINNTIQSQKIEETFAELEKYVKNPFLILRHNFLTNFSKLGNFISKEKNIKHLELFLDTFDFSEMNIMTCVRTFLSTFTLPGEYQVIVRVLGVLSKKFYQDKLRKFQKNIYIDNISSNDIKNVKNDNISTNESSELNIDRNIENKNISVDIKKINDKIKNNNSNIDIKKIDDKIKNNNSNIDIDKIDDNIKNNNSNVDINKNNNSDVDINKIEDKIKNNNSNIDIKKINDNTDNNNTSEIDINKINDNKKTTNDKNINMKNKDNTSINNTVGNTDETKKIEDNKNLNKTESFNAENQNFLSDTPITDYKLFDPDPSNYTEKDIYIILYSIIILNTNLHSTIKFKTQKDVFISNVRKCNLNSIFPDDFISFLYDDIKETQIMPKFINELGVSHYKNYFKLVNTCKNLLSNYKNNNINIGNKHHSDKVSNNVSNVVKNDVSNTDSINMFSYLIHLTNKSHDEYLSDLQTDICLECIKYSYNHLFIKNNIEILQEVFS
ncbi:hypothetical protein EDEG_00003 [Edhazardia aedis USNM 41457]|uniref:SEC7 domain-containing protein n=1 Tax=Edhazardia aedis (strain USNM 41457) TaxID=1003232 RepID=J9DD45_EDHAE|nr:hypothetical protein EDEG_00003 [Edhazardia aedis USNM 41457]|eukprot:EJW05394.1 hypothetical protein EDEG_00003 [Edhazardia aedis USNM 41457]